MLKQNKKCSSKSNSYLLKREKRLGNHIYIYVYIYIPLKGFQWSWAQIPLRPTFYSYLKESLRGDIHYIYTYIYMYIYIYIQINIYQFESQLNMCWINKEKMILQTQLLSKYFAFFTEASSV